MTAVMSCKAKREILSLGFVRQCLAKLKGRYCLLTLYASAKQSQKADTVVWLCTPLLWLCSAKPKGRYCLLALYATALQSQKTDTFFWLCTPVLSKAKRQILSFGFVRHCSAKPKDRYCLLALYVSALSQKAHTVFWLCTPVLC